MGLRLRYVLGCFAEPSLLPFCDADSLGWCGDGFSSSGGVVFFFFFLAPRAR